MSCSRITIHQERHTSAYGRLGHLVPRRATSPSPEVVDMDNEKSLSLANEGDMAAADTKQIRSEKGIHNIHDGVPAEILDGHLVELEVDLARVIAEDDVEGDWDADTSPFPAVRAVVPEYDDTEMPVNTFRAWFLGIVCYG